MKLPLTKDLMLINTVPAHFMQSTFPGLLLTVKHRYLLCMHIVTDVSKLPQMYKEKCLGHGFSLSYMHH